jgi:hypothetical protein
MKKLLMVLVVLFAATSLFAGGKSCESKAANAKSVVLTGTLERSGDAQPVFHVANGGPTYTVCEKTKSAALPAVNQNVQVKGKVVTCGEHTELVIEESKKL